MRLAPPTKGRSRLPAAPVVLLNGLCAALRPAPHRLRDTDFANAIWRVTLERDFSHRSFPCCISSPRLPILHRWHTEALGVIGTDTLRISVVLHVSSDDQERERGSEDNPNVKAHQSKPCHGSEFCRVRSISH